MHAEEDRVAVRDREDIRSKKNICRIERGRQHTLEKNDSSQRDREKQQP